MSSPFSTYPSTPSNFATAQTSNAGGQSAAASPVSTPSLRGRPPGKRGRKPRGAATGVGSSSPRIPSDNKGNPLFSTQQFSHVHWAGSAGGENVDLGAGSSSGSLLQGNIGGPRSGQQGSQQHVLQDHSTQPGTSAGPPTAGVMSFSLPTSSSAPQLDTSGLISLGAPGTAQSTAGSVPPASARPQGGAEEDGEGEDELLPAMADDDYSAQLSWQSQSKDNLKYVSSLSIPVYIHTF